jgi:hypothetical protein
LWCYCWTPWLQFIDRLGQQQPHERCWKALMARAKRRQAELEDPKVDRPDVMLRQM